MKPAIFILFFTLQISAVLAQKHHLYKFYPNKMTDYFDVRNISNIYIYNEWTQKGFDLNIKNLKKIKNLFVGAQAGRELLLKPGHLYLTISFSARDTTLKYTFYMYDNTYNIYYDPGLESSKIPALSIKLDQKTNWAHLK